MAEPFLGSQKVCIAICTPMPKKHGPTGELVYDTISPLWHRARSGLHMPTNINICEVFADGLEVGVARSQVAASCLNHNPPVEFLFFLDYDVLPLPDALTKLFFRARCYPDHDIFAGVYCCKGHNPPEPLIYGENGQGSIWNWTVGDILTTESHGVKSLHMGLTLIRTSLFQKMIDAGVVHGKGDSMDDEPFFKTINEYCDTPGVARLKAGTEDIYFCHKAIQAGAKILVDTSVLAGHEDKRTGVIYGLPYADGPAARAKWMPGQDGTKQDQEEAKKLGKKLALDIGAGGTRREWEGHITYTTDIRPGAGDYCQDTLMLNLPPDHFDLVASSHHLEHIGRWDQEQVWGQIFKVCKPGGRIEHIVPSLDWAAQKLITDGPDEHVINVLYGAQEAHGYARIYNLHYFGYTKSLGKALAEAAGFVNVMCEDWTDRPELGYNLIIRGDKPADKQIIKPEDIGTVESLGIIERLVGSSCSKAVIGSSPTDQVIDTPPPRRHGD